MKLLLLLVLAVSFNGGANVILKFGMKGFPESGVSLLTWFVNTPLVWLGGASFALGFFVYSYALSKLDLSLAYPAMVGLSYVVVALSSWLLLDENFNAFRIIGLSFILVGMILLAFSTS